MKPNQSHALGVLVLLAGASACGEVGPSAEITARRTASRPSSPVLPGATPRDRFEVRSTREASDDVGPALDYDLPEGWKTLARTNERLINLRPAGDPESECSLSFLPGSGGGLEANVNRWRGQLGAEPLSGAEIAALPEVELLGKSGTLVEAAGTYTGMSQAPRAGFALLGVVVSEPAGSLFLKFTGPAGVVAAEREHFLAFARSLRLTEEHAQGDGHGDDERGEIESHQSQASAGEMPPAREEAGALAWKTPPGWTQQPPRAMREVTFTFGEGAECYVTRLVGDAGGLRANLDRWSDQVGRGRLSDEAFAALEELEVLGQEVPWLEAEGTFKGMDGIEKPDQGLLGVAVIRAQDSLFVKLTGPADVVRAERANFLAFVASLEERP